MPTSAMQPPPMRHTPRLKPVTVAVLAALAAVPAMASANQFGDNLGTAFRVDTNTTTNGPGAWHVASDATGDFVVTWDDNRNGTDTIYARLYAADGTPVTTEFMVSTSTATSDQRDSVVAMDAAGDFVVAWDSQDGGSYTEVYSRRYGKDGTPLDASQIQVSTNSSADQRIPAVAMDASGDFVVTWGNYGSTTTIQAKTYTSAGSASSEFQVNTGTLDVEYPTVAMDATGDFVISYSNKYAPQGHVYASLFKAGTTSAITTVQVDTLTSTDSTVFTSTVAMDAEGDFVVAWGQLQYGGPFPVLQSLVQRFNPDGTTDGSQINLPTDPLPYFGLPTSVSVDAEGDFIVGWMEYYKYGPGKPVISRIQTYNKDGTAVDAATTLGDVSMSNILPSVAMDAAGDTVAFWMNYDFASPTDYPLVVQRFAGQGVDLASSMSVATGSVTAGDTMQLTVGVDNASKPFTTGVAAFDDVAGSALSGTEVDLRYPSVMTFDSASGTDWTCSAPANNVLSCTYSGTIAPGASAEPLTVTIKAPTSTGVGAFLAEASGVQADPDSSNNYSALAVEVTPAPVLNKGNGGGAFGWLSLGILGLLGWRRRRISNS